jgi:tetratricopeptide (TPR) repeat protein
VLACGLWSLSGCVYFNSLYNARTELNRAEQARIAGDDAEAQAAYRSAIERAEGAVRRDPRGRWADDALYVEGRAWFRLGDMARAEQALREARVRADDPIVRRGAGLFLGASLARQGDVDESMTLLNEAMRGLRDDPLLADGHFWRGQVHFARDEWALGFWDLARAAEADPRLRVPAMLERLRYAIGAGDTLTQRREVEALLSEREAAGRLATLVELVDRIARVRSPHDAADLLSGAREAAWGPENRDRLALRRSELLLQSGAAEQAEAELAWVAEGPGPLASEARVRLARQRLRRVTEATQLERVRSLLRPAAGHPAVIELARSMRMVEVLGVYAQQGGEPLGWFAAAEVARDELGAEALARGLFRRFALADPDGAWAGKALLAATALMTESQRAEAVAALATRVSDPYIASARTGQVGGGRVGQLERELAVRLAGLQARARDEAERFDRDLRGSDPGDPGRGAS